MYAKDQSNPKKTLLMLKKILIYLKGIINVGS